MRVLIFLLLLGCAVVLVIAVGPEVLGYHHGFGGLVDAAGGEKCIRWFGSVWCKTD